MLLEHELVSPELTSVMKPILNIVHGGVNRTVHTCEKGVQLCVTNGTQVCCVILRSCPGVLGEAPPSLADVGLRKE